jgi:hypothetical protein
LAFPAAQGWSSLSGGGEDEGIPAALLQMPIERLGLQFRSIASAFFRVCGTSRCSMTSFCRKYSSGSHRNLMVLSSLKTPRSAQKRPANHGIGPVTLAAFHFDPKPFGGHCKLHGLDDTGGRNAQPLTRSNLPFMPSAQHFPPALSCLEMPPDSWENPEIQPQVITCLHDPDKSGQTDFFPWRYRLFSGLFLRDL